MFGMILQRWQQGIGLVLCIGALVMLSPVQGGTVVEHLADVREETILATNQFEVTAVTTRADRGYAAVSGSVAASVKFLRKYNGHIPESEFSVTSGSSSIVSFSMNTAEGIQEFPSVISGDATASIRDLEMTPDGAGMFAMMDVNVAAASTVSFGNAPLASKTLPAGNHQAVVFYAFSQDPVPIPDAKWARYAFEYGSDLSFESIATGEATGWHQILAVIGGTWSTIQDPVNASVSVPKTSASLESAVVLFNVTNGDAYSMHVTGGASRLTAAGGSDVMARGVSVRDISFFEWDSRRTCEKAKARAEVVVVGGIKPMSGSTGYFSAGEDRFGQEVEWERSSGGVTWYDYPVVYSLGIEFTDENYEISPQWIQVLDSADGAALSVTSVYDDVIDSSADFGGDGILLVSGDFTGAKMTLGSPIPLEGSPASIERTRIHSTTSSYAGWVAGFAPNGSPKWLQIFEAGSAQHPVTTGSAAEIVRTVPGSVRSYVTGSTSGKSTTFSITAAKNGTSPTLWQAGATIFPHEGFDGASSAQLETEQGVMFAIHSFTGRIFGAELFGGGPGAPVIVNDLAPAPAFWTNGLSTRGPALLAGVYVDSLRFGNLSTTSTFVGAGSNGDFSIYSGAGTDRGFLAITSAIGGPIIESYDNGNDDNNNNNNNNPPGPPAPYGITVNPAQYDMRKVFMEGNEVVGNHGLILGHVRVFDPEEANADKAAVDHRSLGPAKRNSRVADRLTVRGSGLEDTGSDGDLRELVAPDSPLREERGRDSSVSYSTASWFTIDQGTNAVILSLDAPEFDIGVVHHVPIRFTPSRGSGELLDDGRSAGGQFTGEMKVEMECAYERSRNPFGADAVLTEVHATVTVVASEPEVNTSCSTCDPTVAQELIDDLNSRNGGGDLEWRTREGVALLNTTLLRDLFAERLGILNGNGNEGSEGNEGNENGDDPVITPFPSASPVSSGNALPSTTPSAVPSMTPTISPTPLPTPSTTPSAQILASPTPLRRLLSDRKQSRKENMLADRRRLDAVGGTMGVPNLMVRDKGIHEGIPPTLEAAGEVNEATKEALKRFRAGRTASTRTFDITFSTFVRQGDHVEKDVTLVLDVSNVAIPDASFEINDDGTYRKTGSGRNGQSLAELPEYSARAEALEELHSRVVSQTLAAAKVGVFWAARRHCHAWNLQFVTGNNNKFSDGMSNTT